QLRIVRLFPLGDRDGVTLIGAPKWLLRRDIQAGQKPTDSREAETLVEFFLHHLGNDPPRPQTKVEPVLAWILAADPPAHLPLLAHAQRRGSARRRSRMKRSFATLFVRAQPRIDCSATQPVALHHRTWILSIPPTLDRHPPDGFRGLVAQCASVDFHESEHSTFKVISVG